MNKTTFSMCFLLVNLFLSNACFGIERYTILDLGVLNGWYMSDGAAINEQGNVAGRCQDPNNAAFIWRNGQKERLTSSIYPDEWTAGINKHDQIAYIDYQSRRSYLWQEGISNRIGDDNTWGVWAGDINDNGQVVGTLQPQTGDVHSFLWENGRMTDITNSGGAGRQAYGINNAGQVTGYKQGSDGLYHAYIWQNGSTEELQNLYDGDGIGYDINYNGSVVGFTKKNNNTHACYWNGSEIIDLDPIHSESIANAINDNSQIVGHYWIVEGTTRVTRAFLWENGTNYQLNNLIPSNSGWVLLWASEINNNGQIVGTGLYNGQTRAFLLNPVPEPSSLLAFCGGTVGLFALRRRR